MKSLLLVIFICLISLGNTAEKNLPLKGGEVFEVDGRTAFLILPKKKAEPIPWVWYAPTLPRLPGKEEVWMFEKFLAKGIAIAGIDVGESFGSLDGRTHYSKFHKHLVEKRGMTKKACMMARSRGGLMLYNWAVEHPELVACIVGVYQVGNLTSYPGLTRAAGAYKIGAEQLVAKLQVHNPVERLAPLAKAKVPVFHIHGDRDKVVPSKENSGLIKKRYEVLGGKMILEVVPGKGHDMWAGWFQSQTLVDFLIANTS